MSPVLELGRLCGTALDDDVHKICGLTIDGEEFTKRFCSFAFLNINFDPYDMTPEDDIISGSFPTGSGTPGYWTAPDPDDVTTVSKDFDVLDAEPMVGIAPDLSYALSNQQELGFTPRSPYPSEATIRSIWGFTDHPTPPVSFYTFGPVFGRQLGMNDDGNILFYYTFTYVHHGGPEPGNPTHLAGAMCVDVPGLSVFTFDWSTTVTGVYSQFPSTGVFRGRIANSGQSAFNVNGNPDDGPNPPYVYESGGGSFFGDGIAAVRGINNLGVIGGYTRSTFTTRARAFLWSGSVTYPLDALGYTTEMQSIGGPNDAGQCVVTIGDVPGSGDVPENATAYRLEADNTLTPILEGLVGALDARLINENGDCVVVKGDSPDYGVYLHTDT